MANNESGSGVDYFELRRRHQEYKKGASKPSAEGEAAPAKPAPAEDVPVPVKPAPPEDAPFMRPAPPAEDVYEEDTSPAEDVPDAYEEDDYPEEDEPDDSGANPFQSFISVFNKVRDRLAARREGRAHDEVLDDSDDGYDDEEPQEERHGPFRFLRRHETEPEEAYELEEEFPPEEGTAPAEDVPAAQEEAPTGDVPAAQEEAPAGDVPAAQEEAPAGDVPAAQEEAPIAADIPDVLDMPEEEVLPEGEAIPVPRATDEDDYDEDEEDEAPHGGGFKKFLNLFIVREDRAEDEPIDEDDYEIDEPPTPAPEAKNEEFDDSLFTRPRERAASEEELKSMGEQENKKVNMTDLMADGLEDGTLSRRERRLLRERQEALARASETEAPKDATIDEPTREYKPVSRPQAQESAEAPGAVQSLFGEEEPRRTSARDEDDDYDEPKSKKRARRDDYDDEDDDYDEPKSKKRARRDDYDDEDDDYDEPKSKKRARRDDYDDEDDDYDQPKSKKRARRDDYDDEDDEPRRGRRYDAYQDDGYDDYEDYDDAPSFGHYVLGFFKVLIAVVLVLAVALFGLYFADQAVPGGVGAYDWLREKVPAIDKILPAGDDTTGTNDAGDVLDTNTTSPDETATPDATDAGTVG